MISICFSLKKKCYHQKTALRKGRRDRMRLKILVAAMSVLIIVFSGYSCKKKIVVPYELLGVWKTADPKYEGCYFEIKEDQVVIKTIEGAVNTNTITGVKKDKKLSSEERIYYIISYLTPDKVEDALNIYYYPKEEGGTLRFTSQEKIAWTR